MTNDDTEIQIVVCIKLGAVRDLIARLTKANDETLADLAAGIERQLKATLDRLGLVEVPLDADTTTASEVRSKV
jgi:hypothetical protein